MKFSRNCKPLLSNSFFLFGARGVGKTSLIRESLESARVWTIDLLDNEQEDHYSRHPNQLYNQIAARCHEIDWVFIDEIQKVPSLLNVVHRALESSEFKSPKFALTGSSARKLKRGSANLLAGRAFTYNLFPLTHVELGQSFDLDDALNWGTLPKIYSCANAQEKSEFLRAYGLTYLKEEIWNENLIDDLDPFRTFLEVVAQTNGTIVNYAKLARDVGIDEKTVKRYFEILEETLIGFHLSAFSRSIRKRQSRSPKFYLFDTGVTRALARFLGQHIVPMSKPYGQAFEQFVIAESLRLNEYLRKDFRFSYFRTKDGIEIDMIVDRPGAPLALIEIKSSKNPASEEIDNLVRLKSEFEPCEAYCFSNDPIPRLDRGVLFVHWQEGLKRIGLS